MYYKYECMYVYVHVHESSVQKLMQNRNFLSPTLHTVPAHIIVSYCVSVITQWGYSALMVAVVKGKTEVVAELVKAGANVDMQNRVCQHACIHLPV